MVLASAALIGLQGATAGGAAAAGSSLGSALLGSSAISAGGSLLGGLINQPSRPGLKKVSTLSRDQKQINKVIMDFLLGREYNARGKLVRQNPLFKRVLEKGIPDRVIAPLTKSQRSGLDFANELLAKVRNPVRPDQDYLKALARGELPNKAAALGAVLLPGESATVGEDGVEKVVHEKDGTVRVVPNPKSVASPAAMALAEKKGQKARIKYGATFGMATGRRKFDYQGKTHWLPQQAGYFGAPEPWDPAKEYSTGLRDVFENTYLKENYAEQPWYQSFTAGGGDISGIWKPEKWKSEIKGPSEYRGEITRSGIARGYTDAYEQFYQSMPEYWENPQVTELMGAVPEGEQEGLYEYMRTTPKYGLSTGLGMQEGKYGWEDPFGVDIGNLQRAQQEYLTGQGYEYGAFGEVSTEGDETLSKMWHKIPAPGEPDPFDWSGVTSQIEMEDQEGFTDFLQTFEGGVFKDAGFRFNPDTGEKEFSGNPEHLEGMKSALEAYQIDKEEKAKQKLETEVGDTETLPADSDEFLSDLYTALGEFSGSFDAEQANTAFNEAIVAPALRTLERETVPTMLEALGGGALFSGARENVIQKATQDLTTELEEKRSQFVYNEKQAHKDRALSAVSLGMDLARLPTDLAGAEADTVYKKAVSASIFAGMEMERALVDSKITNDQLLSLVTVWNLFEAERSYNQSELDVALVNALKNGDWTTIYGLMMGYMDMDQIAFTPS